MSNYIPDAEDVIWMDFNPQAGREQAGHRPAIVLSTATYNGPVGLAIVCPVTSRLKNYPFEVPFDTGTGIFGAALADQIKSVDWKVRRARKAGRIPATDLRVIHERVRRLLNIE